jgi:hypothetical protein
VLLALDANRSYHVPSFTFSQRVGHRGSAGCDVRPWLAEFGTGDMDSQGCAYVGAVTVLLRTLAPPPGSEDGSGGQPRAVGPKGGSTAAAGGLGDLLLVGWTLDPESLTLAMQVRESAAQRRLDNVAATFAYQVRSCAPACSGVAS